MPEAIPVAARLRASPDVIGAEMGGAMVLLHMQSWTYLDLNPTAMFIWNLLATPRSLDAVVSALGAEYDVDAGVCEREASAFLGDLCDRGFVILE